MLTAFTDGCSRLRGILADAGVVEPPILNRFHIAMRLKHLKQISDGLTAGDPVRAGLRKLWTALRALNRYLVGQSACLINYAERHRARLRVGTAITEGTTNFLVNRRMTKVSKCPGRGAAPTYCFKFGARSIIVRSVANSDSDSVQPTTHSRQPLPNPQFCTSSQAVRQSVPRRPLR